MASARAGTSSRSSSTLRDLSPIIEETSKGPRITIPSVTLATEHDERGSTPSDELPAPRSRSITPNVRDLTPRPIPRVSK